MVAASTKVDREQIKQLTDSSVWKARDSYYKEGWLYYIFERPKFRPIYLIVILCCYSDSKKQE